MSKFNMGEEEALQVSRYWVEEPNGQKQVVFKEEQEIKRGKLKAKVRESIEKYDIYNGFKMTKLLTDLISRLEDNK